MITNNGRDIIAKYLIGQAPSYASYMAFGCGAKPLSISDSFDYSAYAVKNNLDFEMFRVPIISRGYVTENVLNEDGDIQVDELGNPVQFSQIVFTAELPSEERYEITEVGVFSAGSNPSAGVNDSKTLYAFSQAENWEFHLPTAAIPVPFYGQPLDRAVDGTIYTQENDIGIPDRVFEANADNVVFQTLIRENRSERCRFLNNMVMVRGDISGITGNSDAALTIPQNGNNTHIHLNGISLNLDKNSAKDELRLAFSVINKENTTDNPSQVRVIVEFASAESGVGVSTDYARFKAYLPAGSFSDRYFVISKKLEELEKTPTFSWKNVSVLKVYVSVTAPTVLVNQVEVTNNIATLRTNTNHEFGVDGIIVVDGISSTYNGTHTVTAVTNNTVSFALNTANVSPTPVPAGNISGYSSKYYVALDAIRLENTTATNPLYGMTGYTVVKNDSGLPIAKDANSSNLVEFRFAMDVL